MQGVGDQMHGVGGIPGGVGDLPGADAVGAVGDVDVIRRGADAVGVAESDGLGGAAVGGGADFIGGREIDADGETVGHQRCGDIGDVDHDKTAGAGTFEHVDLAGAGDVGSIHQGQGVAVAVELAGRQLAGRLIVGPGERLVVRRIPGAHVVGGDVFVGRHVVVGNAVGVVVVGQGRAVPGFRSSRAVQDDQTGEVVGQVDAVTQHFHAADAGFLEHPGAFVGKQAGRIGEGFIGTVGRHGREEAEIGSGEEIVNGRPFETGDVHRHHAAQGVGDVGDGTGALLGDVDTEGFVIPFAVALHVGPGGRLAGAGAFHDHGDLIVDLAIVGHAGEIVDKEIAGRIGGDGLGDGHGAEIILGAGFVGIEVVAADLGQGRRIEDPHPLGAESGEELAAVKHQIDGAAPAVFAGILHGADFLIDHQGAVGFADIAEDVGESSLVEAEFVVGDVEIDAVADQGGNGRSAAGEGVAIEDGPAGFGEGHVLHKEVDRQHIDDAHRGRIGDIDHGDPRFAGGDQGIEAAAVGEHLDVVGERRQSQFIINPLGRPNRSGAQGGAQIEQTPFGPGVLKARHGRGRTTDLHVGGGILHHVGRLHGYGHGFTHGSRAVADGELKDQLGLGRDFESAHIGAGARRAQGGQRHFRPGKLGPIEEAWRPFDNGAQGNAGGRGFDESIGRGAEGADRKGFGHWRQGEVGGRGAAGNDRRCLRGGDEIGRRGGQSIAAGGDGQGVFAIAAGDGAIAAMIGGDHSSRQGGAGRGVAHRAAQNPGGDDRRGQGEILNCGRPRLDRDGKTLTGVAGGGGGHGVASGQRRQGVGPLAVGYGAVGSGAADHGDGGADDSGAGAGDGHLTGQGSRIRRYGCRLGGEGRSRQEAETADEGQ